MKRSQLLSFYAIAVIGLPGLLAGCTRKTAWVELEYFAPQLAESGVRLAVKRQKTLAYLDVAERSPHARRLTRMTHNAAGAARIGIPALSPTADVLVYALPGKPTETGRPTGHLWRQALGAYAKTQITRGRWLHLHPALTPDGRQVVFTSDRTTKHVTLWRIRLDGAGGIARLTNSQSQDYRPSVSPDGKLVAYASNLPEATEPQIWTITSGGTLPTQLRPGQCPRFSPNGRKILFLRRHASSGHRQLWIINSDGTHETQLSHNLHYQVKDPCWSPDGKWIAFAANRELNTYKRRHFDLWAVGAYGGPATRLTSNGSWDDAPCWDRTGQYLYFRSNRGARWDIWRLRPELHRTKPELAQRAIERQ
jgi:WD40 repeat protein